MKKNCKIYRLAAVLMSAVMLCGIMPVLPAQSAEETAEEDDTLLSFDILREMFPTGRYWNHMGQEQNDPKMTTNIPCDHSANGTKYCNKSYQYDSQCYGYAQELGLLMYGTRFREWERDKSADGLKPGDVITYGYAGQFGGHTVMVIDVKGDTVYYTDCNTGYTCRINWGASRSKEFFTSQLDPEPGKVDNNWIHHAPFEAPAHFVDTGHIMTEEEAAGQTLPDGGYRIVSSLKRNFFLNHSAEQDEAPNVQMNLYHYAEVPGDNDIWEIAYQNNGFYTIREKESGQYLSVSDDSTDSRTNVILQEQNDSDTQLWSVSITEKGYEIRSKCGAWYLNVESMKVEDGKNVQVWLNDGNVQTWGFIPETEGDRIPEGMYYIRSVSDPDYYLHITELDASQVIFWKCQALLQKEKQDAFSVAHFQYDDACYGIGLPYDDCFLYLDLTADYSWEDHLKEGCELCIYNGTADAKKQSLYWDIRSAGDGSYYIVSSAGGYYLSSDVEANGDEGNLSQRHFTGEDCQKWILERVKVPGEQIDGDVNNDGICDQNDAAALQNWLLVKPDASLTDWSAGDLNDDNKLDAADLSCLKQIILNTPPVDEAQE